MLDMIGVIMRVCVAFEVLFVFVFKYNEILR